MRSSDSKRYPRSPTRQRRSLQTGDVAGSNPAGGTIPKNPTERATEIVASWSETKKAAWEQRNELKLDPIKACGHLCVGNQLRCCTCTDHPSGSVCRLCERKPEAGPVCWHCGASTPRYVHCKLFCDTCGQLLENCNGD